MEVHTPRPFHGWREFAKEVGIVVLGVLIALAAGQVVETLRHREIVGRGEGALRDNFARFVEFSAELDQEAPCTAARLGEIRAIIDKAAATRRLPRVGPIPQPLPRPWQIDTWDAMVASQGAVYVPGDREVLYSRIAMSAIDVYADATEEWAQWGALRSLTGPPRRFGEAEEARARETLARAAPQSQLVRFLAQNTVLRIARTGLLDRATFDRATRHGLAARNDPAMCLPITVADR